MPSVFSYKNNIFFYIWFSRENGREIKYKGRKEKVKKKLKID